MPSIPRESHEATLAKAPPLPQTKRRGETMSVVLSWLEGRLQQLYGRMKEVYLQERAEVVPAKYRSAFVCVGGASEAQFIIGQMVPRTARKVLIVGPFGGRDFYYLKTRGHEVFALDIGDTGDFDNLSIGNVEEDLPYEDGEFHAIVMGEVLEHLVYDAAALLHLRRVLKDDGVLVITVPLLDDKHCCHVRTYTRRSIVRLLGCCGWKVQQMIERPGLWKWPPALNLLHHALNALFFVVFRRTFYKWSLPVVWRIEYFLGRYYVPLRRFSPGWGAYLCCTKADSTDYLEVNRMAHCE